jgi:hypothetical protein
MMPSPPPPARGPSQPAGAPHANDADVEAFLAAAAIPSPSPSPSPPSPQPTTSSSSSSTPTPSNLLADRGIAALTAAAGSDESILRGKYMAVGLVVVGMIGALGVAFRPLYRPVLLARAEAAARQARAAEASALRGGREEVAGAAGSSTSSASSASASASSSSSSSDLRQDLEEKAARIDELVARLNVLQARHRERHPMWYGVAGTEGSSTAGDKELR